MEAFRRAGRSLADDGVRAFAVRLLRFLRKRSRCAFYRAASGLRLLPKGASPIGILQPYCPPYELKIMEAIWQLGARERVSVALPDYVYWPFQEVCRLDRAAPRLIPFSTLARTRTETLECRDGDPTAIVLMAGLLHMLPGPLVEEVLSKWHVVWGEGKAALLSRCAVLEGEEQAAAPVLDRIRHEWSRLKQLKESDLLYDAPWGAKMRCHDNSTDLQVIEEVWSNYFGWGVQPGPADIVVDIGAHIGSFAVACGMRTISGAVFAYEPCPDNYRLLEENVRRNCPGRVKFFPCAVHRDSSPRVLYLDPENSGGHNFEISRTGRAATTVPCVSLAEVFRQFDGPAHILKLDCEGSEYDILYAHAELIRDRVHTIVMEAHRSGVHDGREMVRFLEGLGFSVQTKGNPRLMLIQARSVSHQSAAA